MKTAAQISADKRSRSLTLACIKRTTPKAHQQFVITPRNLAILPLINWKILDQTRIRQ